MTSRKLYMVTELPYHKYKDVNIEVKMFTWSLAEAKVEAKKCTARHNYGFADGSDAESDAEGYSSNFHVAGGILTVSAEVVRHAMDIKSSKLAVLKQFAKANIPSGTVIPTTKRPLVEHIYNLLVISDNGRIVYAEDVAKEKAVAESKAKAAEAAKCVSIASTKTTSVPADKATPAGDVLPLDGSESKKRKLDE